MNVVWTEGAAQDLTEIVDYIADDSPEAARRAAKHIFDSLTRLGRRPIWDGSARQTVRMSLSSLRGRMLRCTR
jgi:plasmid stabilization system protein ParE